MYSAYYRLTQVFNSSKRLVFDDNSRLVFFSDCHRGDKSKADNFEPNRQIYLSALNHYYSGGFTYIEIGDGDELWENDRFSTILSSHPDVFSLLNRFHMDKRLYLIYGNHDISKRSKRYMRYNLSRYRNINMRRPAPFSGNIAVYEGLVLRYRGTGNKIFVVHGHQGDFFNDALWPVSRFLVRNFWRHFEILAYRNSISPARNMSRMNSVESGMMHWAKANKIMVIAGHTHNPAFPESGQIPYFNDGCCVKRDYITCIEIQNGKIALVKWNKNIKADGTLSGTREVLRGPENIKSFFQ